MTGPPSHFASVHGPPPAVQPGMVGIGRLADPEKKNRLDCSKLARYPPAVLPPVSPLYEQRRRHVRIQDLKYGKLVDKSVC